MNQLITLLTLGLKDDPRSAKRFVTGITAMAAIALHQKFGITLTDLQMELIAAIAGTMMLGSNYLDAAKAKGASVANLITTTEQADDVLLKAPPKPPSVPPGALAALLACAVAFSGTSAYAQEPSDAPKLIVLKKDQTAPFDGRLYSDDFHVETAKRIRNCEVTLQEVEPKVGLPVWQVVLITVGTVVLTASVAVPVTLALKK